MAWQPDYVTQAELREYATRDGSPVDDAFLDLCRTAASRAVDQDTGRQFGNTTAQQRVYDARPDYERGYWCVDVDDFQDAAGLVVTVVGEGTVATFDKAPLNAAVNLRPWTRIEFTAASERYPSTHPHRVAVDLNVWGWTAVPATVKEATLIQAHRWATRRQAPFGIAGSPEAGSEMRLLAKVDPDMSVMLRPYRRIRSPQ